MQPVSLPSGRNSSYVGDNGVLGNGATPQKCVCVADPPGEVGPKGAQKTLLAEIPAHDMTALGTVVTKDDGLDHLWAAVKMLNANGKQQ